MQSSEHEKERLLAAASGGGDGDSDGGSSSSDDGWTRSRFKRWLVVAALMLWAAYIALSGAVWCGSGSGSSSGSSGSGDGGNGWRLSDLVRSRPAFEAVYEKDRLAGLEVEGQTAFGRVVFEQSRVAKTFRLVAHASYSDDAVGDRVRWEFADNRVRLVAPADADGNVWVNVNVTVTVPADVLGSGSDGGGGLPGFDLSVPSFCIDYSDLGSSGAEFGDLRLRVAHGSVLTGTLATNHTSISVANGSVSGALSVARNKTDVNLLNGSVDLALTGHSQDRLGEASVRVAKGNITGRYVVEHKTNLAAANGDIHAHVFVISGADHDHHHHDHHHDHDTLVPELLSHVPYGLTNLTVVLDRDNGSFTSAHSAVNGPLDLRYSDQFQGTFKLRNLVGAINVEGDDIELDKKWFGVDGVRGEDGQGKISVRTVHGDIDFSVGK